MPDGGVAGESEEDTRSFVSAVSSPPLSSLSADDHPLLIVRGSLRFAPDLYRNKRTGKLCVFPLCGTAITIAASSRPVVLFPLPSSADNRYTSRHYNHERR